MNELMKTDTMSSLQIAEITGKPHNDVMKAIRKMESAWEKISQGKFSLTFRQVAQPNGGVREIPCYELTKTECLYIATKFNDEARAKLVLRWQELELANQPKVPTSFREALLLAAEQQGRIEEQQKEIDRQSLQITAQNATIKEQSKTIDMMKPKASYYDAILNNPQTLNATAIASDYGMTPNKFNKLLHKLGIQKRVGRMWIPYAKYISEGYTKVSTDPNPNSKHGGTYTYSRWTQKGRLFLYEILKKEGIIPLIEQNKID